MDTIITRENLIGFRNWLHIEEKCNGTIEKYMRDIERLYDWLDGDAISKEKLIEWKEYLIKKEYEPITINSILASTNTFCRFMGMNIKVRFLRIQRRLFRNIDKELTKDEYEKLISAANRTGNHRLAMIMETIAATGIRVSEVQYITVEAAKTKRTQISLKGKIRDILLPGKLCKKLLRYAKKRKITSGEIFITKNGKGISRRQIWSEMKAICSIAGVEKSKVFPHNLRHLFARIFYQVTRDVAKLADLLGHSSIETTRIYLLSTGEEHALQIESLGLIL